jgi:HSP20 family protein
MLSDDALCPQIDIHEEDDRIVVKIELPGVDNSNLSISCEGQQLNISGTLEQLREDKDSTGLLQSRQKSSRFSRSIPLPHLVVAEKMETTTHKNQIIVTIPRA